MTQRIAYFVNRYPAVSHTFIRREILALEAQGFDVLRVALHGHNEMLVDDADLAEREKTHHILSGGAVKLLRPVMQRLFKSPGRFFAALKLAFRTGWRGTRPLPFHMVYFAEACSLANQLEAFGATHVHAHFGTNSTAVVMLARVLGGPPYSFTVHGPEEFDDPRGLRLGEKARHAAFVVAITSYARAQLCRWVDPAHWDKIKVVRCGLEPGYFDTADAPSPESNRFVCIGRLNEQKGQLLLLDAARELAARGRDFKIILIGDGELRAELEAFIRQHELQNHVTLTGSLSGPEVKHELLHCRALVLPSFAEGLPIVIMEAMAAGCPVLTTYVAGIPELVRPGENGWLIPPGSVDELVAAMEAVLDCPADRLAAMGASGRQRVKEKHSADVEAAKLADYIKASA
ncbi:MAG: glycosyltransferase family 4 protein [Gammaproteobacteria bacterium]|nr:glycosyltransferase family 4 protein [Gammaproteobacteria bacterium]